MNPGYAPHALLATANVDRLGSAVGSALLLWMVLMALGSPLMYRGWQTRQAYRELTELPLLPSDTASAGELVTVSGRIRDTDEKVTSPVQSTRCELAFWKVATLERYDVLNHMSYWSVAGIGIDAEALVIAGESRDIRLLDISSERTLSGIDELNHLIGSNGNTALDSIARALDPPAVEERRAPSEDWPAAYDELGARVDFDPETAEAPGLLGRLLNALRTPEGTVQFQETTLRAGDTVTVVGSVTGDQNERVRLRGNESIDPIITRLSPSELAGKRRREYLWQLYGIPLFITALASLAAVGAYL